MLGTCVLASLHVRACVRAIGLPCSARVCVCVCVCVGGGGGTRVCAHVLAYVRAFSRECNDLTSPFAGGVYPAAQGILNISLTEARVIDASVFQVCSAICCLGQGPVIDCEVDLRHRCPLSAPL